MRYSASELTARLNDWNRISVLRPLIIRNSSFAIRHSSFVICHCLLTSHFSPFTFHSFLLRPLTDHESRASRLRPWRFPPCHAVALAKAAALSPPSSHLSPLTDHLSRLTFLRHSSFAIVFSPLTFHLSPFTASSSVLSLITIHWFSRLLTLRLWRASHRKKFRLRTRQLLNVECLDTTPFPPLIKSCSFPLLIGKKLG